MKSSNEKNFFIFGDSITQGFWDSKGGWPTRLKQYFDDMMAKAPGFPDHGFYYMVFPLGITDDTTQNILERFEFETEKRIVWPTTEEIFIFSIGSNDSATISKEEFERNLREIIKRARRFSDKISFLELQPVNEDLTQPVAWDEKHFLTNEKTLEFNKILLKVMGEEKVSVIKYFDEWMTMDYKKFLADGVHPNDAGHEDLFRRVRDFIKENYL